MTTSSLPPVFGDQIRALTPTGATLDRLRERLATSAAEEGILDVAYRRLDSPIGSLLIAVSPLGVVRIAFASEDHDAVLDDLAVSIGSRIVRSAAETEQAARQLGEYFEGERRTFDLPLDVRLVHGFRREVIEALRQIAYGHTQTYAGLAAAVGRPAAVRAVGSACGHNPLPIVVPCHRVVRSDGSIGQYLGGIEAKATLLGLEGAR